MTKKQLKIFKNLVSYVQADLNRVCDRQRLLYGDFTEGVLQDLHTLKEANEIIEHNEKLDTVQRDRSSTAEQEALNLLVESSNLSGPTNFLKES